MVAGGRECAGFCEDGRRLSEAVVADLVFGHWDAVSRLPTHRPLQERFRNFVLAEMRQRIGERLLFDRMTRAELCPRLAVVFAVPEAEELRFDGAVGAVGDAVAVQVTAGAVIPDLHLRRRAELQAARLECDTDLAGVDP